MGVHNTDSVIFPIRKVPFTLNRRNLEVKCFIPPLITSLNTHGFYLSCCLFLLNLAKFETRATVVKFCVFSKQIYFLFYPFWHQSVNIFRFGTPFSTKWYHVCQHHTRRKSALLRNINVTLLSCARFCTSLSSGLTRRYLFFSHLNFCQWTLRFGNKVISNDVWSSRILEQPFDIYKKI